MDLSSPPVLASIVLVAAVVAFLLSSCFGASKKKFLDKSRQKVELGDRVALSHDTVRFRFLLPKTTPILGLPVGKHFKIFCSNATGTKEGEWNGREDPEAGEEEIERKYTPTTSDGEVGYVDLVIKVYKGGLIDRFPDGGKMSQYMDSLKPGDNITISGPWGMNEYLGRGQFMIGKRSLSCKKLGMIAGGTGITPMLQVITAILKDPRDSTEVALLYANQTENDILVRDMLEDLQAKHPKRFKLWYTLDRPPSNWMYSTGFITDTMIAEHLPGPHEETVVLMCGPPPMIKFACQANLDKLGYPKNIQVAF